MLSFGYYDYMGWWEGRCGPIAQILKFCLLLWAIDPLLSDALLYFYDNKQILILIL